MAKVIADTVVRVDLDAKKLNASSKQAGRNLKNFSKTSSAALKTVATSAVGLTAAVAATTAGVLALANGSGQAATEIINLSKIAGTNTNTFQKMKFAAAEFNVEQDKLSDILKDVNDKFGDFFKTGGGPLKDFFETIAPKVGLTAENFKTLSGPQALQLYVSSLEKANVSQAEMTFFMEAIASDATALVPLFQENGKLLGELSEKAERFNTVISEQDLASLSEVDKNFKAIGASIENAKNLIATAFLPEIKKIQAFTISIVSKFSEMIKKLREAKEEASKQRQIESQINDIIGTREKIRRGAQNNRNKALTDEQKNLIEINKLLLRQKEIEEQLTKEFVKRGGRSNRGKTKEAFEQAQEQLRLEKESNAERIAMLSKESEKAQQILELRQGVKEVIESTPMQGVNSSFSGPSTVSGSDDESTSEAEKQQAALDAIKSKYLTEQELYREHREIMAVIGEEFDLANFDSEEQWRSVKEQAEQDYFSRLKSLREKSMTDLDRFNSMSWRNQTSTVLDSLTSMTQGVAQSSKTMFKINKAAAIGSAIVNTAQAITKALSSYPPPLSFAMAAAQGAAGLAQISAIKSTSFGSSSGVAAGAASNAPSDAGTVASSSDDSQPSGTLSVAPIDPDAIFSGSSMQAFGERIYDYSKDGGKVVFEA